MINVLFLHHPSSPKTFRLQDFDSERLKVKHINCGFTNEYEQGYREIDFFPNYASYNSALFETSCILTMWEHIDEMYMNDGPVMISHTDIIPKFSVRETIDYVENIEGDFAIGTTVPSYDSEKHTKLVIENIDMYRASMDPWKLSLFDGTVDVWGLIKILDKEAWEFSMDTDPVMIYSHQFCASRRVFDNLCLKLSRIATQMRLGQCGLWTPHVFERIIAIRLAMETNPVLLASFSHLSSSGPAGNGAMKLYGPRMHKFLRTTSRMIEHRDNA